MSELIARTPRSFAAGAPLAGRVSNELRVDIEMFGRGGIAVLNAIEAMGYNTLSQRPSIGRGAQAMLLGRALHRPYAFVAPLAEANGSTPRETASNSPRAALASEETAVLARQTKPSEQSHLVDASYEECRRIAKNSASNFYYAFFLLPEAKRRALCALYAFMRLVDDVSDDSRGSSAAGNAPDNVARKEPRACALAFLGGCGICGRRFRASDPARFCGHLHALWHSREIFPRPDFRRGDGSDRRLLSHV